MAAKGGCIDFMFLGPPYPAAGSATGLLPLSVPLPMSLRNLVRTASLAIVCSVVACPKGRGWVSQVPCPGWVYMSTPSLGIPTPNPHWYSHLTQLWYTCPPSSVRYSTSPLNSPSPQTGPRTRQGRELGPGMHFQPIPSTIDRMTDTSENIVWGGGNYSTICEFNLSHFLFGHMISCS